MHEISDWDGFKAALKESAKPVVLKVWSPT